MEKFVCRYCGAIYSAKVKKLTEKQLEDMKELKKIVEGKYEEFLEKRKNLGFWKIFRGFFDMEIEYLKTNDFDMWLFNTDRENWRKKENYGRVKDITHLHQCPICKKYRLLSLSNTKI